MTADRVFGLVFALVGVGMFYMAQQIAQPFAGSGDPGPQLLPNILSIAMVVLGAALALRQVAVISPKAETAAEDAQADEPTTMLPPPSLPRRLGIAACFVLFLALFEPLGFTVSATLFLAITMSLMDELSLRRILTRSVAAFVIVVLTGLLLGRLLYLPVPGIWFV